MTQKVEDLIRHWGLRDLRACDVLFLTGAGISSPAPSSFPLGKPLHRLLIASYSSLSQGEIGTLLSLDKWALEQTCDLIFEECEAWQPHADVNWFWNLLSELFIYRSGVAWMQPNDFHRYFRRHIELGGRHFTANLDQFIELDSMHHVLTTCRLESTDVPINVNSMISEPIHYKFHGDCNVDAVHLQGVLHRVIRDGFPEKTRRYWSGVLESVKLVCVCGYGGLDSFDVNRYFEAIDEKQLKAKAIWINYSPNAPLDVVPNTHLPKAARMILSRFSESRALAGESDELLNVLFQGSVPTIHRHLPGPYRPEYEQLFQINIQAYRQIPGFQGCLDNITRRLRKTIHDLYVLTSAEHEHARKIAYLMSCTRGGGKLPPYDLAAASNDFCKAAGQVIANRN